MEKMEVNKLAKKVYEEIYTTQKYEDSILHNTFGKVIELIIEKAKNEED